MTNEEARKVLKGMGVTTSDNQKLSVSSPGYYYVSASKNDWSYLRGEFVADELEAIAMWMRDPAGVSGDAI